MTIADKLKESIDRLADEVREMRGIMLGAIAAAQDEPHKDAPPPEMPPAEHHE